jgi:hypothetical protein
MTEEDSYLPPAWEAEPSAIPGLSRGEFERIAERILWFSRQPLEARFRSFARHRLEQRRFEALRVIGCGG